MTTDIQYRETDNGIQRLCVVILGELREFAKPVVQILMGLYRGRGLYDPEFRRHCHRAIEQITGEAP